MWGLPVLLNRSVVRLRWSARPAERFVQTAVTLTVISLSRPSLRGRHRHHHRPPRATPRRCDGDDPHPGAEPAHPDRLTTSCDDTAGQQPCCWLGVPDARPQRIPVTGLIQTRCGQPRRPLAEAGAQVSPSKLAQGKAADRSSPHGA